MIRSCGSPPQGQSGRTGGRPVAAAGTRRSGPLFVSRIHPHGLHHRRRAIRVFVATLADQFLDASPQMQGARSSGPSGIGYTPGFRGWSSAIPAPGHRSSGRRARVAWTSRQLGLWAAEPRETRVCVAQQIPERGGVVHRDLSEMVSVAGLPRGAPTRCPHRVGGSRGGSGPGRLRRIRGNPPAVLVGHGRSTGAVGAVAPARRFDTVLSRAPPCIHGTGHGSGRRVRRQRRYRRAARRRSSNACAAANRGNGA